LLFDKIAKMKNLFNIINNSWLRVIATLFLLGGIFTAVYKITKPEPAIDLANLPPISLNGIHRLMILAPHCDDESLGSGGLIQATLRAGIQVEVVIATNGDGFLFATIEDFKKVYPTHADFIRFGKIRQQESLRALADLGVGTGQVIFLSYPDRGSPAMWNDHWLVGNPYRSPYSGNDRSPYPLTYNPASVYAGADYLADLLSIMRSFKPDMVVYPHSQDVHPDHWGLNVFTHLALTLLHHEDASFQPVQMTYLVHRPDFPDIKGYHPGATLTPPLLVYGLSHDWNRLDLSPEDETIKWRAIQEYRSQLPLLHNLMDSFIRVNEIFSSTQDGILMSSVSGDNANPETWQDPTGSKIPPVVLDPAGDLLTRSLIPAGDLVSLYATLMNDKNLLVCAQVREDAGSGIRYLIRVKVLAGHNIVSFQAQSGEATSGWLPVDLNKKYACAQVVLTNLSDPWAVLVGATTESAGRIEDETAWQMLLLVR
jgi:LmbE family N-acetylglucosaminyl deacetylase